MYTHPFGLSLSKPVQAFAAEVLPTSRDSPRRATYFSLLRQRNLRKRKATRWSGSFRFAPGNCGARQKWGLARTRLRLKQSRALIRFCLRSSAQPDGWKRRQLPNVRTIHPEQKKRAALLLRESQAAVMCARERSARGHMKSPSIAQRCTDRGHR